MSNENRQVRFNARYVAVLAEFMGKSDVRYYLNGAFVTPHNENGVLLVASDGHTMVIIHDPKGETNGDHIFPLSKPLIAAAKKRALNVGKPEAVELIGEAAYVRMLKEDLAYDPAISVMDVHVEHCPPIDGKYPDIRRVIPKRTPIPSLITLNPEYVARLAKVGKALGFPYVGASLFTYGMNASTAVRLTQLPEALFIVMPMRPGEEIKEPIGDWLMSWVKSGEEDKKSAYDVPIA